MDVIKDLIEKRKDLFKQVEAIDTVLKIYGYKGSDYLFEGNPNDKVIEDVDSKIFPFKARMDKQILWLFENALDKGLKLKDANEAFQKHSGDSTANIENTARRLKKEGKLIIVKYNGTHVYSYWGLPHWVEGNDFKQQHKPDPETLPEIESSEIIRQ